MIDLILEKRWCASKEKKPFISKTKMGSSNDSETWMDYASAEALAAANQMDGIGFFLSRREKDNDFCLCVIDIDAHHTDGKPNPNAGNILRDFADTYIEKSPGGNGYHILCNVRTDRIPLDSNGKVDYYSKNAEAELEIYIGAFSKHFFTVSKGTLFPRFKSRKSRSFLAFS